MIGGPLVKLGGGSGDILRRRAVVTIRRSAVATVRYAAVRARAATAELTARGASTTEVMLAGNWKTARMVAHYSAGATAERGAVAKYL